MAEKIDPATLGARLARENSSLRLSEKKYYNRSRSLEEAIRRHAEGECDCKSERMCLLRLYRLIPTRPRPTLKQRMLDGYRQIRGG